MRIGVLPSRLLLILPTVCAITLTDFQPINGFSSQCTAAYNTPLQGCTPSDFQSGHTCSSNCITFLEAVTKLLNTDCKGISAFPNTLIGLFFTQQGTTTLCPNVLGSSGGDAGDHSYGSAASPSGPSSSAESQSKSDIVVSWTSALSTSTSAKASSSSAAASSTSSSSSASDSTTTSIIVIQTSIAMPTSSGVSSTVSSSKSSTTPSTSSTAKEANTGGTILDLGSTGAASPALHRNSGSLALLGISVLLVLLL